MDGEGCKWLVDSGRERWMEVWGGADGGGVRVVRGGWRDGEGKMVAGWGKQKWMER